MAQWVGNWACSQQVVSLSSLLKNCIGGGQLCLVAIEYTLMAKSSTYISSSVGGLLLILRLPVSAEVLLMLPFI